MRPAARMGRDGLVTAMRQELFFTDTPAPMTPNIMGVP